MQASSAAEANVPATPVVMNPKYVFCSSCASKCELTAQPGFDSVTGKPLASLVCKNPKCPDGCRNLGRHQRIELPWGYLRRQERAEEEERLGVKNWSFFRRLFYYLFTRESIMSPDFTYRCAHCGEIETRNDGVS
jgi:hypothetical protein